jgi:pyridoxamine 5'-phosphate oxidase
VNPLTSGDLVYGDFSGATDPWALFQSWFDDAVTGEPRDPTAMALATIDADGAPNVRIVLMKGFDPQGFVFYTNSESAKGRELDGAKQAAIAFYWKSLNRQVRARGAIARVTGAEADAYYATRPYGARIGAWASDQSRVLDSRATLEARVKDYEKKYPEGSPVPRPPHWLGYRLTPHVIEFWHDRPFRLHDRIVFKRAKPSDAWTKERLYP